MAYIPALAEPVVIDTADLPAAQAQSIEQQIHAADFFKLPATVGAGKQSGADRHTYLITVEDGAKTHRVQVQEAGDAPGLADLIRALERHAKEILRARFGG